MPNLNEKIVAYGFPVLAGFIMFFGLVMILFSPSTTGHSIIDLEQITSENLSVAKDNVNGNLDKVPKFVKTMFGNERLNVVVSDGAVEKTYGIVTSKGKILSLDEGALADPTMDVRVKTETIERISTSEDKVEELRLALKSKEIDYSAHKFKSKMRVGLARTAFSLYSLFK